MTERKLIPRTCTEVAADHSVHLSSPQPSAATPTTGTEAETGHSAYPAVEGPRPLSAFREVAAYVLLGEPGAGKTTEFEQERRALGNRAVLVPARRFARADIAAHPEWREKVLFIDGLDETRAGGLQATEALDEITARLEQLGPPQFRISCRAADWLGPVDRRRLAEVFPDRRVVTLQLDPLNRFLVHDYLAERMESDPEAFLNEAESRGLGYLLDNPFELESLITTTNAGGRPATRREALEGNCRALAQERRPAHPRSAQLPPPEPILAAAGRLCAIQLLTGADGFTLAPSATSTDFIPVAEVAADVADTLAPTDSTVRDVFATSLFAPLGDQFLIPKHRQIAEFLAAAHIARLVETGTIPVSRVLTALTSRIDDRIVTDLRGLAAWLGTLCGDARHQLIRRDPVGMGLYGDISEWSVEDRRTLIAQLIEQAQPRDLWGRRWFDKSERRFRNATAWAFRNLCSPDMAGILGEYLGPAQRGSVPNHVLEFLLRSLAEIEDDCRGQLHQLVPHVRKLALSPTTQPDVRLAALLAFTRIEPSASEVETTLLDALEAVREGHFADPDDEIAGSLLRLLYPHAIGPDRIWEYASLLRRGSTGASWNFWRNVLFDETPAEALATLLDRFTDDAERLWPVFKNAFAEDVLQKLLFRTLQEIGHQTDPERLYRWISAIAPQGFQKDPGYEIQVREVVRRVIGDQDVDATDADENADVSEWLRNNNSIAEQLLRVAIARSADVGIQGRDLFLIRDLLLAAGLPDFVEWCAQQARDLAPGNSSFAYAFLKAPLLFRFLPGVADENPIERLKSALANDPELLNYLKEYLTPSPTQIDSAEEERWHQKDLQEIRAGHEQERRQRQHGWRDFLRESRSELANNRFSAHNLHTLALAYLGRLPEINLRDPQERVAEFIGDNSELLRVSLKALRDAPLRDDLPTAEQTAKLAAESKHDWLAYPVLAGLAIRESAGTLDDTLLSDDIKRRAVAMYAGTVPMPTPEPAWPECWLRSDPSLVLEVLHKCSIAAIKRGDAHLSILDWMNRIDGLEDELRDFRLGLLRSISVRLPAAQIGIVDQLLVLVSEHRDKEALKELVAQKLRSLSMTNTQRVRWMTLDALMNGGKALGLLDDFIGSNAKRARQVAECLSAGMSYPSSVLVNRLIGDDSCATLRTLIGIIGRNVRPREIKSGEVVSIGLEVAMSDLVNRWINELGGQPTQEAGEALDSLMGDERLRAWQGRFEPVSDRQRRLLRDASYAPLNVSDVRGLLRNGPPANVADLSVLLQEHLRDLESHIRGDNSDPWRQFWADDQTRQPETPKHEESCRDALLAMLRSRLPDRVDAQPEGQYAADRRADIRVASKDFNIPIEIKKNAHAELWTSIQDQLIAKYTTDPETGGYGIYLVLWFGADATYCPRHPTDYDQPKTPEELAHKLNESLSHEQHRTISVVVVDVTKPENASIP